MGDTKIKIVILAGGFGTRISEESHLKPKPMIEVASQPILIHIMKYYHSFGFDDFIICLGYKSYVIKEYFNNLQLHQSDAFFDYKNFNNNKLFNSKVYPWKVTLVDTGLNTMTGGRIKRIEHLIHDETFMITYGDGLSDIDIHSLVEFHNNHKGILTISAVNPEGRFGMLGLNGDYVKTFSEKPRSQDGWINGGFMVASRRLFDYLSSDITILEKEPMEKLAKENNLTAFKHYGFWQPMDTLRDKITLEKLVEENKAPWIR